MKRRTLLQSSLALLGGPTLAAEMDMDHHAKPQLTDGARFVPPPLRLPVGQALQALPRLRNDSAQAGMFSATLVAAAGQAELVPGKPTAVWAYNGQVPGPLVDVPAGSTVTIAFENRLPQPTTVHWHGLPVPADQDGSPHDAVPPGGKRTYQFTLPPDFSGTCWYHAHPHGHTAEQVFRGLAGGFIVRDPADALAALPEQHLLISDLRLDALAQIPPNTLADWADGREGQFVLVNGQWQPQLTLAPGSRTRLRIWNATSARYLRLALPGAQLTLVGTDGGLLEHPVSVKEWTLAPAERIEMVVTLPPRPTRLRLQALPYHRGKMAGPEQTHAITLMQVLAHGPRVPTPALPTTLRRIDALPEPTAQQRVIFSEGTAPVHRPEDLQFLVNGQRYDPDRIDLESTVGATEQWELVNGSAMDHPFHIHGAQFQVLERNLNGDITPEPWRAWKDTVNLRHAERVTIRMRQDHPGLRMFHCHILEHETLGMMGNLMVRPRS